jgi:hypothetical protein
MKINTMYISQIIVTTGAAFMSAKFNTQHDVLPGVIAWPLAFGFEAIYLSGLVAADRLAKSRWIMGMVVAASLTSFIYGMLYVLGSYHVIPNRPEGAAALGLALAHVLPMPVLSLCAAKLYHASRAHVVAAERAALDAEAKRKQDERDAAARRRQEDADAEAKRTQELRAAEVARRLRNQQEEDALRLRNLEEESRLRLENQRKDAELVRWETAQKAKAQLRPVVAQSRSRNHDATATATARTIVYDGVEYPTIEAAGKAHGISRQAMAKRLAKQKEAS